MITNKKGNCLIISKRRVNWMNFAKKSLGKNSPCNLLVMIF